MNICAARMRPKESAICATLMMSCPMRARTLSKGRKPAARMTMLSFGDATVTVSPSRLSRSREGFVSKSVAMAGRRMFGVFGNSVMISLAPDRASVPLISGNVTRASNTPFASVRLPSNANVPAVTISTGSVKELTRFCASESSSKRPTLKPGA